MYNHLISSPIYIQIFLQHSIEFQALHVLYPTYLILFLYLATQCHAVDLDERVLPLTSGNLCYLIYYKRSQTLYSQHLC